MLPPVSSSPGQLLSSSQDELPRVLHRNRSSRTLLSLCTIKSSPDVYCSVVLCTPGQPPPYHQILCHFLQVGLITAQNTLGLLRMRYIVLFFFFLHFLLLISWIFHIWPSVILWIFIFSPLLSLPFHIFSFSIFLKILFTVRFFSPVSLLSHISSYTFFASAPP